DPGLRVATGVAGDGHFLEESGRREMRRLISRRPDIDAVFAASDLMAIGAIRALREAGRKVPDDVAVVGFDDAPIASMTIPSLTTIRQPLDTMTSVAADLLVRRLGNGAGKPEHIVCATTFVRRTSA